MTEEGDDSHVREGFVARLLRRWLYKAIDDLVFISAKDETLHQHRQGNGLFLLLFKALCSQMLPLLCLASMLQFVMYRSVLAAMSVSIVVLSLMSFPHIPFVLWVLLLRFNFSVVFVKMLFQLPIVCADGTINLSGDAVCKPVSEVTFLMTLGLYKVENGAGAKYDSLRSVLWADLFACVAVLLNMLVARYSGRCHSGLELLQLLRSKDSAAARGGSLVGAGCERPASHASHVSVDRTSDESGLPAKQRLLRHWHDFRSRLRDVSQVLFDGRLRRPSKDLYAIRFFVHMIILVMIMLAWSTLMNSSRTFSVSLLTNNFDGAQVRLLIGGVLLAVFDRILYAWYRTHPWTTLQGEEDVGLHGSSSGGFSPHHHDDVSLAPSAGASIITPTGATRGGGASWRSAQARSVRFREQQQQHHHHQHYGHYRGVGAQEQQHMGLAEAFWFGSHRVVAGTLQKALLIVELIMLHYYFVKMWTTRRSVSTLTNKPLSESNQNEVATMFYILCLLYLALTSLQMKYDVHVMRGGMRFTHSTDLMTKWLFRGYNVMPFLHELRVLTDWTITATSMDFFAWMKFEDAYHILYQTRCDMECRIKTARPGHRQPLYLKFGMGLPMLFGVLALLIGPVVWFSSLNVLGFQPNVVKRARLDISLELDEMRHGSRKINLYSAEPGIVPLRDDQDADQLSELDQDNEHFLKTEVPVSRQKAIFPVHSDSFSMVPHLTMQKMRDTMLQELQQSDPEAMKVRLIFHFSFEREYTMNTHYEEVVKLSSRETIEQLAGILAREEENAARSVDLMVNLNTVLRLTASSRASSLAMKRNPMQKEISLEMQGDSHDRLLYWSFGIVSRRQRRRRGPASTPASSPLFGWDGGGRRITRANSLDSIFGSVDAATAEATGGGGSVGGGASIAASAFHEADEAATTTRSALGQSERSDQAVVQGDDTVSVLVDSAGDASGVHVPLEAGGQLPSIGSSRSAPVSPVAKSRRMGASGSAGALAGSAAAAPSAADPGDQLAPLASTTEPRGGATPGTSSGAGAPAASGSAAAGTDEFMPEGEASLWLRHSVSGASLADGSLIPGQKRRRGRRSRVQVKEQRSLELFLISEDIAKASVNTQNEDTGEDTPGMSMKSLYLGVVLTVGSLLRSFFKLSSQRVIYEEMPNTDLLLDLCNGVYIARIQGNLEVEWKLYHELIRIYRSPEVLMRISVPKAIDDVGAPGEFRVGGPTPSSAYSSHRSRRHHDGDRRDGGRRRVASPRVERRRPRSGSH